MSDISLAVSNAFSLSLLEMIPILKIIYLLILSNISSNNIDATPPVMV